MATSEPYFDPVSHGNCDFQRCPSPAKFRASWAQGTIVKLVCPTHKLEVEGKLFSDLSPSTFVNVRRFA